MVEIGDAQGPAVSSLLRDAGFGDIRVIKDLAGRDRVVAGYSRL
jgi:release factor glutamine methyltransferase